MPPPSTSATGWMPDVANLLAVLLADGGATQDASENERSEVDACACLLSWRRVPRAVHPTARPARQRHRAFSVVGSARDSLNCARSDPARRSAFRAASSASVASTSSGTSTTTAAPAGISRTAASRLRDRRAARGCERVLELVSRIGRLAGFVTWTNTTRGDGASCTPSTRSSGVLPLWQPVDGERAQARQRRSKRSMSENAIVLLSCQRRKLTQVRVVPMAVGIRDSRVHSTVALLSRIRYTCSVAHVKIEKGRRVTLKVDLSVAGGQQLEKKTVEYIQGVGTMLPGLETRARRAREGRQARGRAQGQGRLRQPGHAPAQEDEAQRVPQGRRSSTSARSSPPRATNDMNVILRDREGQRRRRRRPPRPPARREGHQVLGRGRAGQRSAPAADARRRRSSSKKSK